MDERRTFLLPRKCLQFAQTELIFFIKRFGFFDTIERNEETYAVRLFSS